MPEPSRVRIRTGLSWLLTLAVIAYALSQELAAPPALPQDDASDADGENDKLRVTDLKPLELSPGAALIVSVDGLTASEPVSVEIAKAPAPILRRSASQLVVRVPRNTAYGAAKLRVLSGSKRSKPRWLTLRPLPRDEMLRNCLGGMAIFLLGLGLVGRALRQYAGRRVRARLSLLTRGRVRPAALGALLGLTMQSTTSVAALLGGLCGARMLKAGAALVLLIGAQLGSAAAAVLFPLIATREALWILCIGVVWWSLAESRVSRALGNAMIGTGLLFHGLGLLQAGFAPLVSDPMLTPYFATFHSHELAGLLACVGAGAALTGLLQGPAAVFAVVMSLAQATGVLSLHDGLAILAGVNLGAVMNTYAATWPFGGEARRMANTHTLLAVVMSAVTVLGVPLWTRAADAIVAGNPGLAAYGAEVLLPRMGLHLGLGFVMSQLAAVLTALVLLPWALRRIDR
ncbi:MAG TPA: Na/Pi symporter, partial [Polyangiales bacterium]|nr:Na/Pi symporter [Polyangiales bacterium]